MTLSLAQIKGKERQVTLLEEDYAAGMVCRGYIAARLHCAIANSSQLKCATNEFETRFILPEYLSILQSTSVVSFPNRVMSHFESGQWSSFIQYTWHVIMDTPADLYGP